MPIGAHEVIRQHDSTNTLAAISLRLRSADRNVYLADAAVEHRSINQFLFTTASHEIPTTKALCSLVDSKSKPTDTLQSYKRPHISRSASISSLTCTLCSVKGIRSSTLASTLYLSMWSHQFKSALGGSASASQIMLKLEAMVEMVRS
eukprot:scpid103545/ scgid7039/ 